MNSGWAGTRVASQALCAGRVQSESLSGIRWYPSIRAFFDSQIGISDWSWVALSPGKKLLSFLVPV